MTDRIDFDQVREVVRIAAEAEIAELEVETPTLKVRVRKGSGSAAGTDEPSVSAAQPGGVPGDLTGSWREGGEATGRPSDNHLLPLVAPMVGTFYRSSGPEASPFVEEGDLVEPGQVVCVIEAMKLFNEIQAEMRGRVARVLVDNASPVEYGQPLFLLAPPSS